MEFALTAVDEDLANAWDRHCGDLPGVRIHRGSILELECDAVVSPANSFGFMDGGIDAVYVRHFGSGLQDKVRSLIQNMHFGEMPVGVADILETGSSTIPFLILAPTMRVPMILRESVNAYLAARAVLLLLQHGEFGSGSNDGIPVREVVKTVAFPGLGTGVGQLSPSQCAHQFRVAFEEIVLGSYSFPRSWAEASERHQSLYTDRPRNLQRS
jgi:O-acetyl-ADP-ribose deacetylase (regulator of RNase III)